MSAGEQKPRSVFEAINEQFAGRRNNLQDALAFAVRAMYSAGKRKKQAGWLTMADAAYAAGCTCRRTGRSRIAELLTLPEFFALREDKILLMHRFPGGWGASPP